MKKILTILFLMLSMSTLCQPLIINNATPVYMTMKGGAYIVVDPLSTTAPTAIIFDDNKTGGIICEEEVNKIVWWLRDAIPGAGSFITVPFSNSSGITVKIKIGDFTPGGMVAGSPDGAYIFSTAPTTSDNKLITPIAYPTTVTNMNMDGVDNSANVVDRFWFIQYSGYTTKPKGTFKFYYSDADLGLITENTLQAQYWNGTSWIQPLSGLVNMGANTVYTITDPNITAPWTLVNKNYPMPIELLNFNGSCQNKNVAISWETESEINNDYFTISKSYDLITWEDILITQGMGNSNVNVSYDESVEYDYPMYIKLSQTDYDGTVKEFKPIYVSCEKNNQNSELQGYYSDGSISFNSTDEYESTLILYDNLGQKLIEKEFFVQSGTNIFIFPSTYAKGIYYLRIIKK